MCECLECLKDRVEELTDRINELEEFVIREFSEEDSYYDDLVERIEELEEKSYPV